jgi:hypothetical protein
MATNKRWQESTSGFTRVDREARVIRGVKVLGLESKNGRRYLKEAAEKAVPRYEGRKIYIDHQFIEGNGKSKPRQTGERWGKLVNVKPDASGELYGDLEYLDSHPMTESILEAAERFNDFGLSHDAGGKMRKENGENVVYEIAEVYSVDIVQDPATNRNLFESVQKMRKPILQVLRENIKLPFAAGLLARMTEMEDIYGEAHEMEMEGEMGGEDQVTAAFRAAVMSVFDGEFDLKTKIEKISMLLDVQQKLGDKPMTTEDDAITGEGKAMSKTPEQVLAIETENKALREELDSLKAEKELAVQRAACVKMLESAKREVADVRVNALLSLKEDADRKLLVESWAEIKPAAAKPAASPSRFTEGSDRADGDIPSDIKEVKKLLGL